MPLHPIFVKTKLYKPILALTKPFARLNQYLNYLKWVDIHNKQPGLNDYYNKKHAYQRRFELHKYVFDQKQLINTPISYYEFGVAGGDMIKFWVEKNSHPQSEFYGFDSFEGLPEQWEDKGQGHFNQDGKTPNLNDDRVEFIKGWFQDSVYPFFRQHKVSHKAVYHLDADIFSATLYVLFHLQPFIKTGDILIFDEFSSFEDEYKALEIFKKCTGKPFEYKFLGAINNYRQVALEVI